MNIEKVRIFDLAACIREAHDESHYLMAEKLVERMAERKWFILYGGDVREVDLLLEIHTMVTQLLETRGKA